MQCDITVRDLDAKQVQSLMAFAAKMKAKTTTVEDDTDDDTDDDEEDTKPSRTKPKTSKRAAASDDDDEDTDDDTDTDDTDDDDGPTLANIMEGFKALNKKNKGDKAASIKILKRFGVKSPNELDQSDYPKVMKLLNA